MRRLWIMAAALALPSGCGKVTVPLEQGSNYVFVTPEGEEFTIEISGREMVREKKCSVMVLKKDGKPLITRYLAPEGRGMREYRLTLGEVDLNFAEEPMWFVRGPAEQGAQFGEGVTAGPPLGTKVNYLGTFEGEEEITVPAGTFKCWRLKFRADSGSTFHLRETRWLCPSVGIVKIHHESGFNNCVLRIEGELKSRS